LNWKRRFFITFIASDNYLKKGYVAMEAKFSPRVKDVISYSREEAIRLKHDYIGTEHLLLGLIREGDGMAIKLLKNAEVDIAELRRAIEEAVKGSSVSRPPVNNMPLTKQAEKVLKITYLEAKIFKSDVIGTQHLLLSILRDEDNIASQILMQFNVNYESFKTGIDQNKSEITDQASGSAAGDGGFREDDQYGQPKKVSD